MGKGGFGKGFGGFGKGCGKGPWFGKGWGKGPAPVVVAATTVAAAAVTGAVVASVVARPARPRCAGKGKGKGAVVIVADRDSDCVLGDVRIRLPEEGIENKMGRRYYSVDVTAGRGSSSWRVSKCYSDFENLRDRLGPEARHAGIQFPPHKHSFGLSRLSTEMAQERRQGLQVWLQRVLEHPLSHGPWSRALSDFLEVDFHLHQPSPSPTVERSSDPDLLLEIEIPKGVEAGQVLEVQVPGGQQHSVVVPKGRHPGDTLRLQFDEFEQTWKPVL